MITATCSHTESPVKVRGLINRGGWFGETYLIGIGCGYSCFFYVVEAGDEQSALDEFVDSKRGHLLIIEDEDDIKEAEEGGWASYLGNEGVACDLSEVRVLERTKVNYFAKKGSLS